MTDLPIICTLNAAQFDERRREVLQHFRSLVLEVRLLDDGYALRFSADDAVLNEMMLVVQLERKCCLFLQFRITIEPNGGPVWLELTGPSGTKAFLEAELDLKY